MSASELAGLVKRLEAVTARLEKAGTGGGASVSEVSTESVEQFDLVLCGKFQTYFKLSAEFGGDVSGHAELVKQALQLQREIVVCATKHKTPKQDVFQKLIKPLSDKVNEIQQYAEKRRSSKFMNHLFTVKEGISFAGWVSVSPKPGPYVKEAADQALFYGNRVIKEYKGKNEKHVEWMRAYTGGINELLGYVKTYHTTGLIWNKEGPELSAAPSGGGPPPPPPPAIQPPTDTSSAPSASSTESQRANLFASINKGGDITKGLRKVTNEMKTHKNPELRGSSVVKASASTAKTPTTKPTSTPAAAKPPVLELQGKKWLVEYQDGKPDLSITDTSPKQTVYVFRCTKSTIKISGKVNSIVLDSCKRVGLCFDEVISSVEVINGQSIQVQVTGKCPTVSIDKTDGCQVFLSKDSLSAEIVTAKSSEMNICVPKADGDFSEHAVPEQFKTIWDPKKKQLVTECTDIAS